MDVDGALAHYGLLLQQDKKLPSVAGIIAGAGLSTSWWGHPKSHAIFACLERLEDRDDVLVSRLLGGKVTYVHKPLWPAFLGVATSGDPWQRAGLSAAALELLEQVEAEGATRAKGPAVRELQQRLLVAASEVHTESGRHEIEVQTWKRWSREKKYRGRAEGRPYERLEEAVVKLGATVALLPWRRHRMRR